MSDASPHVVIDVVMWPIEGVAVAGAYGSRPNAALWVSARGSATSGRAPRPGGPLPGGCSPRAWRRSCLV